MVPTTTRDGHAGPAAECLGVRKTYPGAEAPALDGFDLTVPRGTVHGLLGHNGAGKTTAIRVLTTLTSHDGGTARVVGRDVAADGAQVRRRIGLVGQYAALDEDLTGRQNLVLFGRLARMTRAAAGARAGELLEQFALVDAADRRIATYSGGMRRRLDLAVALLVAPEVLFVDEPTTGLDPAARREVWDAVRRLVAAGTTVLLTTQYLEEADQLADRISLMADGRVVADGTPDELKARIGGDLIELTPSGDGDVDRLSALAAPWSSGEVHVAGGKVSVPVVDRVEALTGISAAVRESGIALDDVAVRTPTLDDAFLELTQSKGVPA
ncbi:daunorubicin/doxorubicin resistance ABC transporter ATP-binding protein DrrA [Saccharomonospora sp. CUA-673]|uniref:ATP-binding cassette domain-containing protein n=1 Tax=Saccharomonospora sp. CUA-673 TaxID=1904969 RepID=UPI00095A7AD3|nr:ATP-binding cassette domain-containing protein [Saccharomonospora sp. CUA-673]OLT49190.1 daunorubicin/doxorubicin resistance ABC transporter ATP-binding protein DrrA [Saccharomonospora sp. CUA-673]